MGPLKAPKRGNSLYNSHKALHNVAERKLLLKREMFEEQKKYHKSKLEAIERNTAALLSFKETLTTIINNRQQL